MNLERWLLVPPDQLLHTLANCAQLMVMGMQLRRRGGKPLNISYPCVILNVMVAANNTNSQYQDLVDAGTRQYATSSQMSIEFEVDGPYKASSTAWPQVYMDAHHPWRARCTPPCTVGCSLSVAGEMNRPYRVSCPVIPMQLTQEDNRRLQHLLNAYSELEVSEPGGGPNNTCVTKVETPYKTSCPPSLPGHS